MSALSETITQIGNKLDEVDDIILDGADAIDDAMIDAAKQLRVRLTEVIKNSENLSNDVDTAVEETAVELATDVRRILSELV